MTQAHIESDAWEQTSLSKEGGLRLPSTKGDSLLLGPPALWESSVGAGARPEFAIPPEYLSLSLLGCESKNLMLGL
jgi:hypothetical protein